MSQSESSPLALAAEPSEQASETEVLRMLDHCIRDYEARAVSCDTPALDRQRAYAEQTADDLRWLRGALPGLLADRRDAERWRLIRSVTRLDKPWSDGWLTLSIDAWKVRAIKNPSASIEEIIDAEVAARAAASVAAVPEGDRP